MSSTQIAQLTLAGFQTFGAPCTVPFGRLTLLYGASGSGKTAVGEALALLQRYGALFQPPGLNQIEDLGALLAEWLDPHWRLQPAAGGSGGLVLAPELRLDLRLRVSRTGWAQQAFARPLRDAAGPERLKAVERRYEPLLALLQPWLESGREPFELGVELVAERPDPHQPLPRHRAHDARRPSVRHRVVLRVDGQVLLRMDSHGALALRFGHPVWGGRIDPQPLRLLAERYPGECGCDAEWFSLPGGMHLRRIGLSTGTLATLVRRATGVTALEPREQSTLAWVESFLNGLWLASLRTLAEAADLQPVGPDPWPRELDPCWLMDAQGGLVAQGDAALAPVPQGLRPLAEEALWEALFLDGGERPRGRADLRSALARVNGLLARLSLAPAGQQIDFDVHPVTGWRPAGDGLRGRLRVAEGGAGVFAVQLRVGDGQGRRLAWRQASGALRQLLPLLVALSQPRGVWVQHPEVQLAPGVQAQVADALLGEGEALPVQHLIETQSELLLLRLLRRVRQTEAPLALAILPGRLEAADLRLVQLSAGPEGTQARVLRVSREGEVMDAWPEGPLEPRWPELFDE